MGRLRIKNFGRPQGEAFWANGYYGYSRALKEYSGYDGKIAAVIPHGVFYEPWVHPSEVAAPVQAVLNWPEFRDEAWAKWKTVVPAASPYLYGLELYPHAKERRGTVLMPQHSTEAFQMDQDWVGLREQVMALPPEMHPVTVCLYFWDVIDRQADIRFPGMRVVSMGHCFDPDFTTRLVDLLTGAKYVCSNEIGSYTYYAVASGTPFFLIGEPPNYTVREHSKGGFFFDSDKRHPEEKRRIAEMRELFSPIVDAPEPAQVAAANYMLRRSAFKTPEGLKADLEYCASIHHMPVDTMDRAAERLVRR